MIQNKCKWNLKSRCETVIWIDYITRSHPLSGPLSSESWGEPSRGENQLFHTIIFARNNTHVSASAPTSRHDVLDHPKHYCTWDPSEITSA
jgi:hypothetical protein